MRRLAIVFLICVLQAAGQANHGSLHVWVTDTSGRAIQTQVQIASEANQYRSVLETDSQGQGDVRQLPYGNYTLEIQQPGFSPVSDSSTIRRSLTTPRRIMLTLATVTQ